MGTISDKDRPKPGTPEYLKDMRDFFNRLNEARGRAYKEGAYKGKKEPMDDLEKHMRGHKRPLF